MRRTAKRTPGIKDFFSRTQLKAGLLSLLFLGSTLGLYVYADQFKVIWTRFILPYQSQLCRLGEISVSGNTRTPVSLIWQASALRTRLPLHAIDLDNVQKNLCALPWIKNVHITRVWPNRLVITITEHKPFASWLHKGRTHLLTTKGTIIDVPLPHPKEWLWLLGENVDIKVVHFFRILQKENKALSERVVGLRLLPSGRIDLYLKNGARVKLPSYQLVYALKRLHTFEKKHTLPPNTCLDLRSPHRLVITPEQL